MTRLLAGLTGLAAAVALAACGGDDDAPIVPVQTTTTPVAELDQDEFVDETDSLCAEANVALASISTTGEAGTQAADFFRALSDKEPNVRELHAKLDGTLERMAAPLKRSTT